MDDEQIRVGAQVGALEIVVKSLVAMLLASQAKQQGDFAKAAAMAEEWKNSMIAQLDEVLGQVGPSRTTEIMRAQMLKTYQNCMDQPAERLRETESLILSVTDPGSSAKN